MSEIRDGIIASFPPLSEDTVEVSGDAGGEAEDFETPEGGTDENPGGESDPQGAETKEPGDTGAAGAAETKEPDKAEYQVPAEIQQRLDEGSQLKEFFEHLNGLAPQKVQQILEIAGLAPATIKAPDFEPQSEMEHALKPHIDGMLNTTSKVAFMEEDMKRNNQQIMDNFSIHGKILDQTFVNSRVALEMMEQVAEMVGLSMPKVDIESVRAAIAKGASGEDAVRAALADNLTKNKDRISQSRKSRPSTPSSTASDAPVIEKADSMVDVWKKMKGRA